MGLFKFQENEHCEDCCCVEEATYERCSLVDELLGDILGAEDENELRDMLHGLVDTAYHVGYTQSTREDVQVKKAILNELNEL